MQLSDEITKVSGIGPIMATKLGKLGIFTVFDLLYHIPFRYEDRSLIKNIHDLRVGDTATVIGTIESIANVTTKKGKPIQVASVSDATGKLAVYWFNQTFLVRMLKKGMTLAFFGKMDFMGRTPALISPDYELISHPAREARTDEAPRSEGSSTNVGRIIPIYSETSGLSSKWLRSKIYPLLQTLSEADPYPNYPELPHWKESLINIHFPNTLYMIQNTSYKKRLAFDELLILQLEAQNNRAVWQKTKLSHTFHIDSSKINQFINTLPFTLTTSQIKATGEIISDLAKPTPMNRLLEGDVGSGKTVVAATAAYISYLNGFQTAILAPTQILAQQHYETILKLFPDLQIGLITANKKLNIKHSTLNILIGTHSLLSNLDLLDKVGLVVIDEQHRFGVAQRATAAKIGKSPHILTMTATPIPRSMALTLYGDLSLSTLDEVPKNRLPIKTWVVPESKRDSMYNWIIDQLGNYKSQVFWVCPLIEDSTSETLTDVKAVTSEFNKLKSVFPNHKLGLLHGKLKSTEKDQVLEKFKSGETDILVTTPVVEVGIDIPGATIMVIEAANRFGLAQLHQLRGRVGRAATQSYCLLFSTQEDSPRLKHLESKSSGHALAELDLTIRGSGNIFGTSQHGLPQLRVADYSDLDLVTKARDYAQKLYPDLPNYPVLQSLVKKVKMTTIINN